MYVKQCIYCIFCIYCMYCVYLLYILYILCISLVYILYTLCISLVYIVYIVYMVYIYCIYYRTVERKDIFAPSPPQLSTADWLIVAVTNNTTNNPQYTSHSFHQWIHQHFKGSHKIFSVETWDFVPTGFPKWNYVLFQHLQLDTYIFHEMKFQKNLVTKWSVGQWIESVISFQKMYGLYGLKHHIVEMPPIRDRQGKIELLSFWSGKRWVSQLFGHGSNST